MATREQAQQHYDEHRYDFGFTSPDSNQAFSMYLTTAQAKELSDILANLGSVVEIEAVHPEFMGWTVEEIAENLVTG